MSQLTITCPSCNETFSADQALQKHLKEKEQKYQEEIKVKEKLLKEKYNLDFKLKEKSLEKELSLKIQEQNKSKFQELRTQIEEAEEEKKTFQKKMNPAVLISLTAPKKCSQYLSKKNRL